MHNLLELKAFLSEFGVQRRGLGISALYTKNQNATLPFQHWFSTFRLPISTNSDWFYDISNFYFYCHRNYKLNNYITRKSHRNYNTIILLEKEIKIDSIVKMAFCKHLSVVMTKDRLCS